MRSLQGEEQAGDSQGRQVAMIDQSAPRNPGPRLWCGCGNWIKSTEVPGIDGPVMVLIGQEPFWFCGVACEASWLEHASTLIFEPTRLPADQVARGL